MQGHFSKTTPPYPVIPTQSSNHTRGGHFNLNGETQSLLNRICIKLALDWGYLYITAIYDLN